MSREMQRQAAVRAMSDWLAHPQELGAPPAEIECAGEFERHDMRYFLLRYRREPGGAWLLGVCGGYEGDSTEHCGHLFSEMEPYDPATAEQKAAEMVEQMRQYWMARAAEAEPIQAEEPEGESSRGGPFVSFVLLEQPVWDRERLCANLEREWGLRPEKPEENEDALVWEQDGMLATVSLMPGPIPNGEAEQNAATNYLWPEAAETAARHRGFLLVAVLPRDEELIEAGKLMVKLCDACLMEEGALGVFSSGTVHHPDFYRQAAGVMHGGELPYLNWIYFGLRRTREGKFSGYTFGLELFDKAELEMLDTDLDPQELRGVLFDFAAYVVGSDVVLHDGETIGFTAEQKLAVSRSPGVFLDGETVKIDMSGFRAGRG